MSNSSSFYKNFLHFHKTLKKYTCLHTYIHTYLLTHSMQQSTSREANGFSSSQEIPCILRNPKIHFRIYNRPPTVPILSQNDPVHALTSHSPKIYLNIILPPTPDSKQYNTKRFGNKLLPFFRGNHFMSRNILFLKHCVLFGVFFYENGRSSCKCRRRRFYCRHYQIGTFLVQEAMDIGMHVPTILTSLLSPCSQATIGMKAAKRPPAFAKHTLTYRIPYPTVRKSSKPSPLSC